MDVAKTLTVWKEQSPEQRLESVNRFLPPVVAAVLVVAIAYRTAELTWVVTPHHTFDRPAPVIVQPGSSESSSRSAANFSALEDSHLFGEASVEPTEPVVPVNAELDAPDTTLGIRLTGLVADEDGELSQAIIASGRGQERKYSIGQEIDNASGASLHSVYPDRVILNRSGQLETLRLPKEPSTASTGRVAPPPPPPQPAADNVSLGNIVSQNASSLTNVLRMAAHVEGGQMIGFRVNPGRDRETFDALGLMPGDIVTDINGVVLDDPSRALQAFDALSESTQASVTVMRDGVPNVLIVDTTQLQSLAEDRQ